MSTVSSATSVAAAVSGGRMAVQIAVPLTPTQTGTSDAMLEAAIQRVSMMLYLRSHCTAPPDALDMGGGVFNVVV